MSGFCVNGFDAIDLMGPLQTVHSLSASVIIVNFDWGCGIFELSFDFVE